MGICEMSLWKSNITPPPWRFLYFLYTLHGQVSRNHSEVAMELSIFVSCIATTWGWWKSRKANNSSFLHLLLLMSTLTSFSPLIKLFLLVPIEEDPVFFPFVRGSNLFWFPIFNWSSKKKKSEKLKNSHFGHIQVQFVFCKVSYRASVMKEHSLWTHISRLSH